MIAPVYTMICTDAEERASLQDVRTHRANSIVATRKTAPSGIALRAQDHADGARISETTGEAG